MTIWEAIEKYSVCPGLCGLGFKNHWHGVIDPWNVVHYADRRFTRRALRNMLLLAAKRDRLLDEGYLNAAKYDWLYLYLDNVAAARMALELGVRLPARLSRLDRLKCLRLARKHGVKLSKRSAIYAWVHGLD